MGNEHPWALWLWTTLAALGGGVSALSFRPYKRMTRGEIFLSLVVSSTFALFVGPLVAQWMFGTNPVDVRLMGAVLWLMAAGAHFLIPLAIRRFGAAIGTTDASKAPAPSEPEA